MVRSKCCLYNSKCLCVCFFYSLRYLKVVFSFMNFVNVYKFFIMFCFVFNYRNFEWYLYYGKYFIVKEYILVNYLFVSLKLLNVIGENLDGWEYVFIKYVVFMRRKKF